MRRQVHLLTVLGSIGRIIGLYIYVYIMILGYMQCMYTFILKSSLTCSSEAEDNNPAPYALIAPFW